MVLNDSHRILTIDGGDIKVAITLGYPETIEKMLIERYQNPNFRFMTIVI